MTVTTEALVVEKAGAPLELRQIELQDPAEDEVGILAMMNLLGWH